MRARATLSCSPRPAGWEKPQGSGGHFIIKGANPSMAAPPHTPTSPRGLTSQSHHLGVRSPTYEPRGTQTFRPGSTNDGPI